MPSQEETERNLALATDYKIYRSLLVSNPKEAAKMMRDLIAKYSLSVGRIREIGAKWSDRV